LQYRNAISCVSIHRSDNVSDIDNLKELKDRKKIAKQIAKTSDSIRTKYRALKTSKMEDNITSERHFKPIVEPLKQIVENTVSEKFQPIKKKTNIAKDISIKRKRKDNDNDNDNDNDEFWMNDG